MVRKASESTSDEKASLRVVSEPVEGFSTPFNVVPLYVVVAYNDPNYPEYHDFRMEARNNITNRERRELRQKNNEIIEYSQWWSNPLSEGTEHEKWGKYDEEDAPHDRQAAMIAPYIRNWNAQALTEEGDYQPLPPPSKLGVEAFDYLDRPVVDWIVSILLAALVQGKGLTATVKAFGDSSGGS